ncbi:hypothetical protein ACP4OV_005367 [Aristida adscensionis]
MDEEELLMMKIRALEEGQAELRREVSRLVRTTSTERRRDAGGGVRWQRPPPRPALLPPSSRTRRAARAVLSRRHQAMVLHSLGQAVHVLDLQGNFIYWNRYAEQLFGYCASEAIGQNITKLLVDLSDACTLNSIIEDIFMGRCWRGKFPVRNKSGERFSVFADGTPLYDEDGSLIGLICLSFDLRMLQKIIRSPPFEAY